MDIRNRVMTSQPFDKTSVVLQKRTVCDQNWAYVEIQDGGLGPSLFFMHTGRNLISSSFIDSLCSLHFL